MVGTDLFVFDNKDYHITMDYFSNFGELDYLADNISTTVKKKLKSHFYLPRFSGFINLR